MGRRFPSVIPEEQPLIDDDEDEEDDDEIRDRLAIRRSQSDPESPLSQSAPGSDNGLKMSDMVVNAFNQYGRRPSVLSSITDHFHHTTERRESMLSHYSASDRARLSKLTTIVSGAELGEETDEIHHAQSHVHQGVAGSGHRPRSRSMSPKLGHSILRFTPLESSETTPLRSSNNASRSAEEAITDGPNEDDDAESDTSSADAAETHMLLDPATELDPINDLELPADSTGHVSHKWHALAWAETKVLCKSAAPIFGTQLLEYSLPLASVISIGHLSTTDLAASALANMTAAVTGYSILQGFISSREYSHMAFGRGWTNLNEITLINTDTVDLVMPTAWTSSEPQRVGYWLQRW